MHKRNSVLAVLSIVAAAFLPGLLVADVISNKELSTLGHRNFVVIADMAYPWQSADGIETRFVKGEHLDIVEEVLGQIDELPHVNPIIYVDAELDFIEEEAAPGITEYREELGEMLDGRPVQELPHMDIIKKLDASAELFEVRILKTNLTLPYTSVFIELDCGYWDAEREAELRKAIEAAGK